MLDLQVIIDVIKDDYAIYLGYFTVLYVMVIRKIHFKIRTKNSKWYDIDPDKSIHSHILFWIAITLPCYIILVLKFPAFLIWVSKDCDFSVFKMFVKLDINKSLVNVIALIAPLSLLVIRMHSSKQTAKQVKNQTSNLQLRNYIDHREYITEKLNVYLNDEKCLVTFDSSDLYKKIFPDLSPRNFDFDKIDEPSKFLEDFRDDIIYLTERFLKSTEDYIKYNKINVDDILAGLKTDDVNVNTTIMNDLFQYVRDISEIVLKERKIEIKPKIKIKKDKKSEEYPVMVSNNGNEDITQLFMNLIYLIRSLNDLCGFPDDKIRCLEQVKQIDDNIIWTAYFKAFRRCLNLGKGLDII